MSNDYTPERLTVAEFRKQMKMALDYCVQGGTIEIDRMGQRFILMSAPRDVGLLVGNTPPNKNWKPSILEDKEISKTLAGDLIAEDHKKIIALATPSGELECCQHPTRPCKHWQWDTNTGEGYKNILSGRFREAD